MLAVDSRWNRDPDLCRHAELECRCGGDTRGGACRLTDPNGVLALAAFSSIFKFVGILAFYPWLDRFSRLIIRISGRGSESAVGHLDPVLAEAGGAVALEAAWRATLELARDSVG
jgi:phosphate:Na+ symporter